MQTNKEKIENVLNLFLDWNFGDLRKAMHLLPNSWDEMDRTKLSQIYPSYDGGAMVGAMILAMCAISSVTQFSGEKGGDKEFIWFTDQYLKRQNPEYDGGELYALRCSLLKNYGLVARMGNKSGFSKVVGFALTDKGPHLQESSYGKLLNVKNFVIDIQLATQAFFVDVLLGNLPKEFSERIVNYHDTKKIGPIPTTTTQP